MSLRHKLANFSVKPKLIALFLLVGVVPLITAGYVAYRTAAGALQDAALAAEQAVSSEVTAKLTSIRDEKKSAVEAYFQTIHDQILTFSEDRMVIDAMRDFPPAFDEYRQARGVAPDDIDGLRAELKTYYTDEFGVEYEGQNGKPIDSVKFLEQLDDDSVALQHAYIRANKNPLGSKEELDREAADTNYNRLHGKVHPAIRSYLRKFGYYDIFLCDPETGDIVYSVFKELDYTTSLIDGPYADTNFGEAFRLANAATEKDAVFLVDYKPYTPSYEAPASFIASPIFDGDKKIGVAIFQMPLDRVTTVMSQRAGLGETGEAYLVGPDNLPRSDTYNDPEFHTVVASYRNPEKGSVDSETAAQALQGDTGIQETTNYLGKNVLSAYTPVNAAGLHWALLTEIETQEAFAPIAAMVAEEEAARSSLIWGIGCVSVIATIVIAAIAWGVSLMISQPIQRTVDVLEKVAGGDLSQRLDVIGKDEFARMATALNTAVSASEQTLEQVRIAAERDKQQQAQRAAEEQQRQQEEADRQREHAEEERQRAATEQARQQAEAQQQREQAEELQSKVDQMLSALEAVSRGDYNARIEIPTDDAVGQLGAGLQKFFDERQATQKRDEERADLERQQVEQQQQAAAALRSKVDDLLQVVAAAAEGDLTVAVDVRGDEPVDELAAGLQRMLTDLREVIGSISEAATQFNEGSAAIADGSQMLASNVQTQSASVEEMTASIEELAASIDAVKNSAAEANETASETSRLAREGGSAVQKSVEAMDLIQESATQITEIIEVISEIASQTNLLALNAAIEAARAGEHGLGFAVVADEVRKLAERANEAAGQIATLIRESATRVSEGAALSAETGKALEQIVAGAESTAQKISFIAQATTEQASSASEVANGVQSVSQATEASAANAEEMAASGEQLGAQANQLAVLVQRFKTEATAGHLAVEAANIQLDDQEHLFATAT